MAIKKHSTPSLHSTQGQLTLNCPSIALAFNHQLPILRTPFNGLHEYASRITISGVKWISLKVFLGWFGGTGSYVESRVGEWRKDIRFWWKLRARLHLNSKIYDLGYRIQSLSAKWTFKDIRSADGQSQFGHDRNKCLFYGSEAGPLESDNSGGSPIFPTVTPAF